MKTYRCGLVENIVGCEWYTIQRRILGFWVTYQNFDDYASMKRVANQLERLGNVVIYMN